VPFILVTDAKTGTVSLRPDGSLRDISPTILGLMKLDKPSQMTGGDLRVVMGS
jgi:2,3-bisphosphoglycerate-independent phosphoglycerate mutase